MEIHKTVNKLKLTLSYPSNTSNDLTPFMLSLDSMTDDATMGDLKWIGERWNKLGESFTYKISKIKDVINS